MAHRPHDFGLADITVTGIDGKEHVFTVDGGDITVDVDADELAGTTFENVKPFYMPLTWEGEVTIENRQQLSPHLKSYFKKVKRKGIEYR